jgi:predicted transcriptional regulator
MASSSAADVVAALHRFGLERDRLRTALCRVLELPVTDLDALEHLELAGPLSQRDLAERLLLTSGAVTVLVDRLEAAGLVSRQPHPSDRRVTLVHPIPEAQLPDLPELQRHHAAVRDAASRLAATARGSITRFLADVTDSAALATDRLTSAAPARRRARGAHKGA